LAKRLPVRRRGVPLRAVGFWLPGTGWAWLLGNATANAWVTWRVPTDDYGYIGWAPMPPAWGWYGGSAFLGSAGIRPQRMSFAPAGTPFSYRVRSYIVRNRYVIHDVAPHTRNYTRMAAGGAQHRRCFRRASCRLIRRRRAVPALQSARVPSSMAPSSRVASRLRRLAASGPGAATPLRSSEGYGAAQPGLRVPRHAQRGGLAAIARVQYFQRARSGRPIPRQRYELTRAARNTAGPVNSAPRQPMRRRLRRSASRWSITRARVIVFRRPPTTISAPAVH